MRCPFCNHPEDKVIDSRESKEGESIRRRRECLKCTRRFTTYERIDEIPYMVVKKDGRREKFDRQKVMQGLVKASEKRPISMGKLADIIDDVETKPLRNPRPGVVHGRDWGAADGESEGTRQDRLCPFRLRVPGFSGCGCLSARSQRSHKAQRADKTCLSDTYVRSVDASK